MQRHRLGMLAQAGFLVELEGCGEAAQAIHLVAHLGRGNLGRFAEARVERP